MTPARTRASDEPALVGVDVVPNGRYFQPEEDLIMQCIVGAARDAGLHRNDLRGIIALTPRPQSAQHYQAIHVATRLRMPIEFFAELEVSAMGLPNALRLAADVIRDRDLPAVVLVGATRESLVPTADFFENRTSRTSDASFVGPYGMSPIAWNALGAQELLENGEATERDFAEVAVRLRANASRNPLAYFRTPITVEEVLSSRMVASPLRLLMVCPRTDGAGALIVARSDIAARDPRRAVIHLAQGFAHDGDNIISERAGRSFSSLPAARPSLTEAFNRASIDYDAVDVIEPWVPFAPMELMVMRALGFPWDYWSSTAVSPSGGLISRGHPILATGIYSLHEVMTQLRGEASTRQVEAGIAMTVSESGNYNACVVDLFARLDRKRVSP